MAFIFKKTFLPKCKDTGMFFIPYKVGNLFFIRAMLDLGASINVTLMSIYDERNLGESKKIGLIFSCLIEVIL